MKKLLIILTFVILISVDVKATDNPVSVTRQELGGVLNKTVRELKVYFAKINSSLKGLTEEVIDLDKKAEKLEEESRTAESNPTLLDQATKRMRKCDYKTQELRWSNTLGWVCRDTNYDVDCKPIPGYEKDDVLGKPYGGYECNYKGGYMVQKNKWNACDNHIGEQHEQWSCLIDNQKADQKYEVSKSKCDDLEKPSLLRQPCGPNGGSSSCRCPGGTSYYYSNKTAPKSYCVSDFKCSAGFKVSNGTCVASIGRYSNSAKRAGGSAGTYYTVKESQVGATFYIDVWTEDLAYDIYYQESNGKVVFRRRKADGWDKNDYVNHYRTNYTPKNTGTLRVYVREGGDSGSDSLGYNITATSAVAPYCTRKDAVYNSKINKCVEPVPTCPLN